MINKTGFWDKNGAVAHHIHSPAISNWINNFLSDDKTKLIYDLGCGIGDYLNDLNNNGFENLIGFEGDPIRKYEYLDIRKKDLTEPINEEKLGNVICLEVGEHIPKEYQNIFLENMCKLCDGYLIFSWAIRGQGGRGHVNELNNDEILPIVLEKGFVLLENETKDVRQNAENFCSYFRNTLFVLKKV
jgi:SAM-dependent methyltransferase